MPSLMLVNGNFHTQDPARPKANAVVIEGNQILAIGKDDEIKSLSRPNSKIIDLDGRLVLPGMIDSHIHFLLWALMRQALPLAEATSLEAVIEQVSRRAQSTPPGHWIMGMGLDESRWPERRLPTRDDLDRVAPDHFIFLRRRDGHLAVVNSRVLKVGSVNEATPDPIEGVIDRDSSGRPTGILKERALDLIEPIIPEPTEEEAIDAVRNATSAMHSLGVTGVHDMRVWSGTDGKRSFRIWQRLQQEGILDLRCWMALSGELLTEAVALGLKTGFGNPSLRIGHLKYFVDGSIGSQTAWMLSPFQHGGNGIPVCGMEGLAQNIVKANGSGLAVAIHAIGDRAMRELSRILEDLETHPVGRGPSIPKRPSVPNRIEHFQIVQSEDLARLGRLNIVVSAQPLHITDDIYIHERLIGDRCRCAYPLRSIVEAGGRVIFGSDCPVSDPNPLWGIHAAVARRRRDGTPEKGWYPEQCLTVDEAVRAYTLNPAIACERGNDLGSIAPGKLADLVVLDQDIYKMDPMEIHRAKVDLTIFDGRIVFQR